jgi:hypothetical protein
MDSPNPCPMCGTMIGTDANRCLYCGESFATTVPKRALLAHVNMAGVLPGWIVGAAAYLIYVILGSAISPGFEVAHLEPVVGVLLSLTAGGLIGSAIAAGWRAFHKTNSESDPP